MEEALMKFKQKVYKHYKEALHDKLKLLERKLQDLINSTNNETKSSAGDKYETGRAMLQIEQDNVRKQIQELLDQKSHFEKINYQIRRDVIGKGSLIKTNNGFLFLSIALGKANVDGCTVIALSSQSPLGSKLLGLRIKEVAVFNNTEYQIESIA